MTRTHSFPLLVLLFLLAACQSDEEDKELTPPVATDSVAVDSSITETIDTVLTQNILSVFQGSGAVKKIREVENGFDFTRFRMVNTWKEDTAMSQPFRATTSYLKGQGNLLKYSPDSAYILDLDSYAIEVNANKQKEPVKMRGPDTEVSLIDLQHKNKIRLLFMGPAGSVEEGGWMDNDNIVLLGMEERSNDGTRIPVIWKYHLPTKTFYLYEYPHGIKYDNQ